MAAWKALRAAFGSIVDPGRIDLGRGDCLAHRGAGSRPDVGRRLDDMQFGRPNLLNGRDMKASRRLAV
ncbi:MAG: hypothetical protein P4L82_09010 [Ancalomicrobiaceae bacterium]|nr:hypothetical protein [Ancalomicrobiaceae bacterium]